MSSTFTDSNKNMWLFLRTFPYTIDLIGFSLLCIYRLLKRRPSLLHVDHGFLLKASPDIKNTMSASLENLFKQLRVKFADSEQQPDGQEAGRIRPSPSFKSERKRGQNWFLRQFSNQMNTASGDDDSRDGEYKTVIAAVTLAIAAEKEAESANEVRPLEDFQSRIRSKKEDPEPGRLSRRFSGKEESSLSRTKSKKEDTEAAPPEPGRLSRRFTGLGLQKSLDGTATEPKLPEKTTTKVPSAKKTIKFAPDDKNTKKAGSFNDKMGRGSSNSTKTEGLRDKMGRADHSSPAKPTGGTTVDRNGEDYLRGNATDTKADTWEKTQLAKIQKRYEKQISTILAWEDEKKKKAKHRLDKKESRLELRRLRATQEYRNEIERVNKIAKDASAIAEERRRNEEAKTRETAREIRSTGKLPVTCFCFR